MDFAWYNNRTILGFYNFSGCYCCLRNFFFLLSELCDVFPAPNNYEASEEPNANKDKFVITMSVTLTLAVLSAFVLLLLVLFAVAQVFLSESLISTLVQNILTFVVTAWFGYLGVKGGVR